MPSILPINLNDLLHLSSIESARVEFKASWDEKTTGPQTVKTICAFANDFQNLNGGYIVIGVGQRDGAAALPPNGLTAAEVEAAQNWIRGRCNTIAPVVQPTLSPELVDGKHILVVWVPASRERPHQVPDGTKEGRRRFYIRLGSETVDADTQPELKTQLLQLTARVPFDNQRARDASVQDIRETKVREFLHDIGSGLLDMEDSRQMYRNLGIAEPVNGHDAPRNIGLLFFSQNPERWFPGARIDVVRFAEGAEGDVIEEKLFRRRPVHEQLRDCLAYLDGLSTRQIQKLPDQAEALHSVSYPAVAIREALANAIQHRSYEAEWHAATKVYIYPDRMEITSYPGPAPGIEPAQLEAPGNMPAIQERNGRIAEFLKELKLAEGRGTGIPKLRRAMRLNGSPPPRFDFDAARSYFRVTLPVHPGDHGLPERKGEGNAVGVGQRLEPTSPTPTPSSPALDKLDAEIAAALAAPEASPFKLALCHDLRLPPTVDAAGLLAAMGALHDLGKQNFAFQRALKSSPIPATSDGKPHAIERAALALCMEAAVRAVDLPAARALCVGPEGLTKLPEKSQIAIAVLMAALFGEVRAVRLDEKSDGEGRVTARHVVAEDLIDLDALPFAPLEQEQALADAVAASVDRLYAKQAPGQQKSRRELDGLYGQIRFAVAQQREVEGRHFRFVVSEDKTDLKVNEAKWLALCRRTGIPLTRIVADDVHLDAPLGIAPAVLETLFVQTLHYLRQAKEERAAPAAAPGQLGSPGTAIG